MRLLARKKVFAKSMRPIFLRICKFPLFDSENTNKLKYKLIIEETFFIICWNERLNQQGFPILLTLNCNKFSCLLPQLVFAIFIHVLSKGFQDLFVPDILDAACIIFIMNFRVLLGITDFLTNPDIDTIPHACWECNSEICSFKNFGHIFK